MSDNARLEGVVGSGAAQKRGAGTVSGAVRTAPPRKAASAAPGAPAPAPVVMGSGPSSVGRHAAARAGAKELMARQAGRKQQPVNSLFEFPPVFEAAVARQVAVRPERMCARRRCRCGVVPRGATCGGFEIKWRSRSHAFAACRALRLTC
jgi:hypothetical protein